jgi:endo-1,4-beta-xylanase
MKNNLLILLFVLTSLTCLTAQDAYHLGLEAQLQAPPYALPKGSGWVLPNEEITTLIGSSTYGANTSAINVSNKPFTQGRKFVVTKGDDPWSSGHLYKNVLPMALGDHVLFILWARSSTPNAKINFFVEDHILFDKQFYGTVKLSNEWYQILVPIKTTRAFGVGECNIGFHMGALDQTLEIGGMATINYKNTVQFSQLPLALNNDYYVGSEPNAPWRAAAAASIEQIRKANLTVEVTNSNGQPIPNAIVKVEMQQHDFGFGTAVVSNLFNNGSALNLTYENKLTNLDGRGHGFNEVVFENDLKWDGWEASWFSPRPELASDFAWLKQRNIPVRGHNLVWPGWDLMPPDMAANKTNIVYLKNRIRTHLRDILTAPGVACSDWDVINETSEVNDLIEAFKGKPGYPTGREIYNEIYEMTDSLIPQSKLYANDYVAIERGDQDNGGIALYKDRLDQLVAAGAPLEGIGFQGHFGTAPTGIPRVKEIYDEFYTRYGLEQKVTEYDIDKNVPPATQAAYMRDILTISFSHPSMRAFLMWGFWDGAHWLDNAPIYNTDWTLKPSGKAFVDLVFDQWWSDSSLVSQANGRAPMRAYKGKHKVTVTCNGTSIVKFIDLMRDTTIKFQMACTVDTDNLPNQIFESHLLNNIVDQSFLQVVYSQALAPNDLQFLLLDTHGRVRAQQQHERIGNDGIMTIELPMLEPGTYFLQTKYGEYQKIERVIVVH